MLNMNSIYLLSIEWKGLSSIFFGVGKLRRGFNSSYFSVITSISKSSVVSLCSLENSPNLAP